jgi:hypothetical protein
VGILVGYKGSHIYKVYIPLRRGPTKNRIVRSLNVRFNKGGLITKPLLEDNINILIPTGNRGKSTKNQD